MKLKIRILGLCVFLIVYLQGCDDNQESSRKGMAMTKEQFITLCTGEPWQLQKMIKENQEIKLLNNTSITFACDPQGNVTGIASINRYSGAFTIDDDGSLNWQGKGFIATKMGGSPEHMRQEQNFLETLGHTSQGGIDGSTLFLESTDKSNVLEFFRATNSS